MNTNYLVVNREKHETQRLIKKLVALCLLRAAASKINWRGASVFFSWMEVSGAVGITLHLARLNLQRYLWYWKLEDRLKESWEPLQRRASTVVHQFLATKLDILKLYSRVLLIAFCIRIRDKWNLLLTKLRSLSSWCGRLWGSDEGTSEERERLLEAPRSLSMDRELAVDITANNETKRTL